MVQGKRLGVPTTPRFEAFTPNRSELLDCAVDISRAPVRFRESWTENGAEIMTVIYVPGTSVVRPRNGIRTARKLIQADLPGPARIS